MKSFYKNEPSLNKPQDTSLTISEDLQGDGYVEKLDETDPDAQVIIRKRKEWQDNINKYRSKVEESLGLPANTTSKRSVTIQKGKQKSKTSLKTSTDIDIIQLMPIWIVMKIFSYLDAKVLKDIKRVNAYWDFVCTHLAEEEKGRKMFDKWIDSIKAEYHVTSITLYPENVRPYYRFTAPVNPLSCDMKVYNTLKKRNTIKPFNISLISAMANDETSLFYPPLLNLQPFQRNVKAQMDANDKEYLHNRAPCTYVDKHKINLIPIKDLPTIGDFIPHVTLNEETKSFIFVPSTAKLDVTSDQAVHMQYSVFSSVNWNSVGKHLEFDEKLSDLMAKSIAHYVTKVTSSVISKEYKEKLIEKHESRNN